MRITLNKIDFEISPVPGQLRAAVLTDRILQTGIDRDVWQWDSSAKKGSHLTHINQQGAIPMPNALTFFVAKAAPNGSIVNNEKLAAKMGQRFLEAVGAKSPLDVLRAMTKFLPIAQIGSPAPAFAALKPVASFKVRAQTEFAVVELREAGRNLTAYLFLPAIVTFYHEITAITDRDGYDALLKDKPDLASNQISVILPPGTQPMREIRKAATAMRISEARPIVEKAKSSGDRPDDATLRILARLGREWDLLNKPAQPAPQPRAQ
jgi:hypothetical protein